MTTQRARWLGMLLAMLLPVAAWGRAGDADPSFGVDGIVLTPTPALSDGYRAVVLQGDGKIVAAGDADDGSGSLAVELARRLSDGSLDPAFGSGGLVTEKPVTQYVHTFDALLQADGKIVLLGLRSSDANPFQTEVVVLRYDDGGTLDATFGAGGVAILGSPGGSFVASQAALQTDGKLVVAGYTRNVAHPDWDAMVARFDTSGSLDATFGIAGVTAVDVGSHDDFLYGLAVQPDGRIVAAGGYDVSGDASNGDVVVLRVDPDGVLDPTFGTGGIVTTDLGASDEYVQRVLPAADGGLVAAGGIATPLGYDVLLLRYDAAGNVDAAFGDDGQVAVSLGTDSDLVLGALLEPDGKIVVAGNTNNTVASADLAIARFRADGALDGSFGTGGVVVRSLAGIEYFTDLALQPDGRIVAAGAAGDPLLARFTGPTCSAVPATGCKAPLAPGKALLQLTDRSADASDKLGWKWKDGEATALAELGDPLATTAYSLCIYDESGPSPALVYEATAPAGGTCEGLPCWREAGTSGFKRRDRSGASEGLTVHVLKSGADGKARIVVKGKGEHVGPPGMPLPLPLRVQLVASDAACFEATYSTALRNQSDRLKARAD